MDAIRIALNTARRRYANGGAVDDDRIPESELPIGPSGVPRITIPALGPTPKEGQQVQPVQPPSPTDVAKAAPRILAPARSMSADQVLR